MSLVPQRERVFELGYLLLHVVSARLNVLCWYWWFWWYWWCWCCGSTGRAGDAGAVVVLVVLLVLLVVLVVRWCWWFTCVNGCVVSAVRVCIPLGEDS